jgi:hypothetical protein
MDVNWLTSPVDAVRVVQPSRIFESSRATIVPG